MSKPLHPITWLMVAAGALHLFGDFGDLARETHLWSDQSSLFVHHYFPPGELVERFAHEFALSFSYFGSAAMVEFLSRIWRVMRQASTA